jgi:antitoxin FitA
MPAVTIRNISKETHRALKMRAATHGRSTEAEIREILENTVRPITRIRMGDALAELGRQLDLQDEDFVFERNKEPATPMSFE